MRVAVANHTFELLADGEEYLRALLPNFRPFETTQGDNLFTITLDATVRMPLGQLLVEFRYTLAEGEQVTMRAYSHSRVFTIRVGDTIYNMVCRREGECWVFESDVLKAGAPRYIIDHFAVQAFSLATLPFETLLIHASTISYEGQGVLFLAESGTGKSTHTRLWRENITGTQLLNDDAPAVRIIEGVPTVFGTPWSGKLPCWKNEHYPIRALVRIHRAEVNTIARLSKLEAITALLPSSLPTLQRVDSDLDKIFSSIAAIISTAPVYSLGCLPNAEAAYVAHSAIF